MGLTNWQLFFQDLQNATTDQPLQDNEVLTLLRQVREVVFVTDSVSYVFNSGSAKVGSSLVGFCEVA